MATLDERVERFYPGRAGENTHIAELFADFLCWCNVNDVWPFGVLDAAVQKAEGVEIVQEHFPFLFVGLHHPTLAAYQDGERPRPSDAVEERAAVFNALLNAFVEELADDAPLESDPDALEQLVLETFHLSPDPHQFVRALVAAEKRYGRYASGSDALWSDEFYTYDELVTFFGEVDVADRFFRETGRQTDAIVSGSEVQAWMRTT